MSIFYLRLTIFLMVWNVPATATEISRRLFIAGGLSAVATASLGALPCEKLLAPSVDRVEILFKAAMAKNYVGSWPSHALVMPNPKHPLHQYLDFVPEGLGYRFDYDIAELPPKYVTQMHNWAAAIVRTQATLAKRFRIPLDRVELELPDILDPYWNQAYWMKTNNIPVDPRPESLGIEFHRAFFHELGLTEPELADKLEKALESCLRIARGTSMSHRFSAYSAMGSYAQRTGRRLSLTLDELVYIQRNIETPLKDQRNALQGPIDDASPVDLVGNVSFNGMRLLIRYLLQIRGKISPSSSSAEPISPNVMATPLGIENQILLQDLDALVIDLEKESVLKK